MKTNAFREETGIAGARFNVAAKHHILFINWALNSGESLMQIYFMY